MPQKKTRKSLKIKFISNEDIWRYMKPGDNDYDDEDADFESQDFHFDLQDKKEKLNEQIAKILAIEADQKEQEIDSN